MTLLIGYRYTANQLEIETALKHILSTVPESKINLLQSIVVPIIEKNWKLIFTKYSRVRFEEIVFDMLKRAIYFHIIEKSAAFYNNMETNKITEYNKGESYLKDLVLRKNSVCSSENYSQTLSEPNKSIVGRQYSYVHCLNPIVVGKIASEISLKFGLLSNPDSQAILYNIISEGVYLQLKDIFGRLQQLSSHRLESLKKDQIVEITMDPRRWVTAKEKVEIEHLRQKSLKANTVHQKLLSTKRLSEKNEQSSENIILSLEMYNRAEHKHVKTKVLDQGLAGDLIKKWTASYAKKNKITEFSSSLRKPLNILNTTHFYADQGSKLIDS
jgi:hypothetical protein